MSTITHYREPYYRLRIRADLPNHGRKIRAHMFDITDVDKSQVKNNLDHKKSVLNAFPGLPIIYRQLSSVIGPLAAKFMLKRALSIYQAMYNKPSLTGEISRALPEHQRIQFLKLMDVSGQKGFGDYPPAMDYRDNYYIPPYEIPVEPNYFPGYNIVSMTPRNGYYAPPTWAMAN